MVAWLIAADAKRRVRFIAVAVGAGFAMGVAWVLVACFFHSLVETVAGSLLGGIESGVCIDAARAAHPPAVRISWLATLTVAVLFGLQHGLPLGLFKQLERKAS